MNRDQLIARFNELNPNHSYDPTMIYDWASAATANDTDLVPLNYVDDMCSNFAVDLCREEDGNGGENHS